MNGMDCKIILVFTVGMIFAVSLMKSVSVTVAWWNGGQAAGHWEWFWIGILPVLAFVFFRYYSVFRPGCRACLTPEAEPNDHRMDPGAP